MEKESIVNVIKLRDSIEIEKEIVDKKDNLRRT